MMWEILWHSVQKEDRSVISAKHTDPKIIGQRLGDDKDVLEHKNT